jgi:5-methylcytosine-specific restriction endonuclease McrA
MSRFAMSAPKTCSECGESLPPNSHPRRRYCTPTCQHRAWRKIHRPPKITACITCNGALVPGRRLCAECVEKTAWQRKPSEQRQRDYESGYRHYAQNRERILHAIKMRRLENPERFHEYDRRAKARAKLKHGEDAIREQQRLYAGERAKRDPAFRKRRQLIAMAYVARKRNAEGSFSLRDWQRLLDRYRGLCAYCATRPATEQEHVIPLSRGGRNTIGNILPACRPCNTSKNDRLLIEWRSANGYSLV